jgi:hypothetical protein
MTWSPLQKLFLNMVLNGTTDKATSDTATPKFNMTLTYVNMDDTLSLKQIQTISQYQPMALQRGLADKA